MCSYTQFLRLAAKPRPLPIPVVLPSQCSYMPTAETYRALQFSAGSCRDTRDPAFLMCSYTQFLRLAAKPRPLPIPVVLPSQCSYMPTAETYRALQFSAGSCRDTRDPAVDTLVQVVLKAKDKLRGRTGDTTRRSKSTEPALAARNVPLTARTSRWTAGFRGRHQGWPCNCFFKCNDEGGGGRPLRGERDC
jgi:hypothetical protein